MADLPEDRVTPHRPPFTITGVDCFGAFLVKRGRCQEKRYGCLFTCLSIRAVHIEKLNTLEADSFLNALFRFSSRRGTPDIIRSDNATNFTAAERELRELRNHLLAHQIVFNPPAASHMGGVWERQIRTVRKVMNALLRDQVLDDERLDTIYFVRSSLLYMVDLLHLHLMTHMIWNL